MILEYLGILSGLLLLVVGADRFVIGAANIARGLGMPPLLIGLTIVSISPLPHRKSWWVRWPRWMAKLILP